jgi:hypothetical protein
MGNIDSIFNLNIPSVICYKCGDKNLNLNNRYSSNKEEVIRSCDESGLNGGVMVIKPSLELYEEYAQALPIIANRGCKYPNEALFEYVNTTFYNLPVKYNLSHYHTLKLNRYGVNPDGRDILIYHFNETEFKHLDIIKDGWLNQNLNNPEVMSKYRVRKIPILHFEKTIYEPYKNEVNTILDRITNSRTNTIPSASIPAPKSDWVEGFSNTYKRPYWSNKKTGKSVWEKPKELSGGKKSRKKTKKYIKKSKKVRKHISRKSRKNYRR